MLEFIRCKLIESHLIINLAREGFYSLNVEVTGAMRLYRAGSVWTSEVWFEFTWGVLAYPAT